MARGFGWRVFAACLLVLLPLALCVPFIIYNQGVLERRQAGDTMKKAFDDARAADPRLLDDKTRVQALVRQLTLLSGNPVEFRDAAQGAEEPPLRGELRFSNELKKEAWYYDYPVAADGRDRGTLRVMVDPAARQGTLGPVYWLYFMLAAFFSVSIAAAVSVWISGTFTRRLKGLSSYLDGFSSRFLDSPREENFGDEVERVSARARSLGDRILETLDMLRDEKGKVRAIIEQLDDGVVLLDAQGRILLFNEAFTRMFGIPHGPDCLGKPVQETVRHPHLLDLIGQYQTAQSTVRREIAIGGGASARHIFAVVSPFLSGSPQKRALVILHDITPQKKIEEMRVDFVANASHELKTPLTAIRGFVETMADGAVDDPAAARQFLGIIQKHTERLGRLVDDLLTLSDIELGKDKPHFAELDPEPVIKSVEQTFSQAAASAKVALTSATEQGIGPFEADKDRLLQILLNLVDNAIKYTPAGGSVSIRCRKLAVSPESAKGFDYPPLDGNPLLPETASGWSRAFVEFSVADTGEGIPPHALPRLMERFYRVDNARSRERGGTGLGLSIVKHLVIAHGGSLRVESEPGKGTRVRFILPERQKRE